MKSTARPISSAPGGWTWPLHPLLLGAFPILSLAAHNRHEVHLAWVLVPLSVGLCLTIVVWSLFALLLRDWLKGAIPASLGMLMFFSFGHVVRPLVEHEAVSAYQLFVPALVAQLTLLLALCALLRRCRRPVGLTRFANAAAVVALLFPAVSLVGHEFGRGSASNRPTLRARPSATSTQRPDVYLIVPDAHARGDVLHDVYGYDAEPFLAELESLGFSVARRSTANYSITPVSIASMLNLDYVAQPEQLYWNDYSPFSRMIRHSTVESLFVEQGYRTVAFPSPAAYTEMRHFDEYHRGLGAALGFWRMVAEITPLAALLEDNPTWNGLLSDRDRLLRTLEDLPKVAHDPRPTFTFVHLCLPHPPFYFGENGEDVLAEYRGLDEMGAGFREPEAQARYPEGYRRQAVFTDRKLLQVVRAILDASEAPPIILLLSDHGPRLNLNWTDSEITDVREALGNLTAVYLPGNRARELIYPTITPLNVMRIALNEALGMDLPLLEDRAFLSTNVELIHRWADVTWRIRREEGAPDSLAESEQRPSPASSKPRVSEAETDNWLAPLDPATLLR